MKLQTFVPTTLGIALVATAAPFAAMASTTPLTTVCVGTASTTSITWSATTAGGVAPIAFLWGNGATTTTQTGTYAPGTYTMTLQATDASSTVATTSCSATVASSTNSTPVSAQVQALLAQIAALKQQLLALLGSNSGNGNGSSTPTSTSTCPVLNRNLGMGSRGDDVKGIQQFLAHEDSSFSEDNVTGFFGPVTAAAIARFQIANGIASSSTGTVGPLTREFVGRHCGEIEGEGHLRGDANSWMDASNTASTTFQFNMGHDHGNDNGNGNSDH